ncbi:sigma-54-dependent transcriptional regulator [Alkaliphilus oremlandii]|uniref:Stage 0 sporulation protein A homolog n=1 Tax=Alkaliphilus oremlandii (strain OhILAs) TaxID=350688 RepID=A8MKM4_ALKOO|nr:sigma-54 dependent transcriptional regulator [Alkaliphilus oremlandii]ABW20356.1 two component, sigma54 specific, transcriptional regulator, Fis family [Alkaliphilus oremlandii OhILAs]
MTEVTKILIVDDEREYRETYRMILESRGFSVGEAETGVKALEKLEEEYYPIVLCDVIMPGIDGLEVLKKIKETYDKSVEVIMVTGYGGVETAVQAMRMGAFGFFVKSHNPEALLIEIGKAKRIINLQKKQNMYSDAENNERYLYQSKNAKMKEILEIVDKVADTSSNVLLLGESGVGKEVLAQKLHDKSSRNTMPFVAINCQYFSDNLLEAELFGHEKGAFTGAKDKRIGRFEEANGGTIFLDEIGEISLNTQVKFLRVLENRKIERMGSNKQIDVDFRLISATNKILADEVKNNSFRQDLFYRINTITIEIPPLRERKEDLLDMIYFFVNMYKKELKKDIRDIDKQTLEYLLHYDYPGNIRELKNIIERLFVLSKDGILRLQSAIEKEFDGKSTIKDDCIMDFNSARYAFEKDYFLKALMHFNYNISQTARAVGISRRQLFNKINEYNLREYMNLD